VAGVETPQSLRGLVQKPGRIVAGGRQRRVHLGRTRAPPGQPGACPGRRGSQDRLSPLGEEIREPGKWRLSWGFCVPGATGKRCAGNGLFPFTFKRL
jgi:hypothetical protein